MAPRRREIALGERGESQKLDGGADAPPIAELARDRDRLEPYRAAAFEAHWRQGKNLEDDGDLRAIAAAAGLDPDEALRAADDPAMLARVDEKQDEARDDGVAGIPTFIIAGEEAVGCQPYEVLADAAERAGVARRR